MQKINRNELAKSAVAGGCCKCNSQPVQSTAKSTPVPAAPRS
jgi:hypothetical protein